MNWEEFIKKNQIITQKSVDYALKDVNSNEKYVAFWGSVFSNFFPTRFYLDGYFWTTSEQYFMWKKAITFGNEEIANKILATQDPRECRNLGRKVKNYSDDVWSKIRYDVMYNAVKAKFTQDALCALCLQKFKTQTFVEGSPIDNIWGVGIAYYDEKVFDEKNWLGQNLLGKILTSVRNEIFENSPKEVIEKE